MPVVDASVLVAFLAGGPGAEPSDEFLGSQTRRLHAPHLLDAEVGHSLRRLAAASAISIADAEQALADLRELAIVRYTHVALLDLAWSFRERVSFYDAIYLALGTVLEEPVVTLDARLARAAESYGLEVEVLQTP